MSDTKEKRILIFNGKDHLQMNKTPNTAQIKTMYYIKITTI